MAADLSRSGIIAKLTEQIMARVDKEAEPEVRFRVLAEEIAKAQHRAGILPEKTG